MKNNVLLFHVEKFQPINNRGVKDEDLSAYGYPSPDKNHFVLMVKGPGHGDFSVSWDIWLYGLSDKQTTKITEDLPTRNIYVEWLNNKIYYFFYGDQAGDYTEWCDIKNPNKFFGYADVLAIDLSDGLYLCLDEDEKFFIYLRVGKLFSDESYAKKIGIKSEKEVDGTRYPATENVNKIDFLSGGVKVNYVSESGKNKDVFVEYPKK